MDHFLIESLVKGVGIGSGKSIQLGSLLRTKSAIFIHEECYVFKSEKGTAIHMLL